MANNQRGRNNNNAEGRNQYSNGWMDTAKDKPFTTAAAAAGAVAAGVFLWSKRNQISDQIGRLSDQITDWAEDMRSNSSNREFEFSESGNQFGTTGSSGSKTSSGATSPRSSTRGTRGPTGTGSTRSTGPRPSTGGSSSAIGATGSGMSSPGSPGGTTGGGANT